MPRILFVATISNPLSARWISQLANTEWDVHVFGIEDEVHPLFYSDNIIIHTIRKVKNTGNCRVKRHPHFNHYPFKRGRYRLQKLLSFAKFLHLNPADTLSQLIHQLQPDCIHSLKMNQEAYITYEAIQQLDNYRHPPWIYSVWGSDIYVNRNFPDHVERINAVLQNVDYLLADNPRDVSLAIEHGYKGVVLGVLPTGGGYPIKHMRSYIEAQSLQRKIIALKGYQAAHGGQVLTALEALKRCGRVFTGYQIIVHSAINTYASKHLEDVQKAAQDVSRTCDVTIDFMPFSPPEAIWKLFGQARIAIAISNADGTPNAMLEAMIMGAFPIQSDTGGLEGWIDSGVNGYLVPFNDVDAIATAIIDALENDSMIEQAEAQNYELTEARLDAERIRSEVIDIYKGVKHDKEMMNLINANGILLER